MLFNQKSPSSDKIVGETQYAENDDDIEFLKYQTR